MNIFSQIFDLTLSFFPFLLSFFLLSLFHFSLPEFLSIWDSRSIFLNLILKLMKWNFSLFWFKYHCQSIWKHSKCCRDTTLIEELILFLINLSERERNVKFEVRNKKSNIFIWDEIFFEKLLRSWKQTWIDEWADVNMITSSILQNVKN
jgi:hypothetical protein